MKYDQMILREKISEQLNDGTKGVRNQETKNGLNATCALSRGPGELVVFVNGVGRRSTPGHSIGRNCTEYEDLIRAQFRVDRKSTSGSDCIN